MSKSKKKSEEKTESELYYVIEKVKIINESGGVIIMQSGQPTPPVIPPKGGQ